MNCDCNDKSCGGLTPLIAPKIKHVFGNVLRLAIPLTLRSLVKDGDEMIATDTDFIPSSEYPVNVVFTRGKNPYAVAATMDGNLAVIEDKGKIPLGTYDITVECRDDGGLPYRFKQSTVLQVVDVTAEAGIEQEIEYEARTWYLDAAVFLATTEIGSMSEIIDLKLEDVFGKTEYDANAKLIRFFDKSGTHELATIDSRPFIVDGTVQDVYIDVSRQVLVVVLNEDAGGRIFTVPLYLVFGEYYKKTEVDSKVAQAIASIDTSGLMSRAEFVNENNNRLKYFSIPPVVLNYIENVSMYEQQHSSLFGTSDGHIKGYGGPTMGDLFDYGSADGFIFVDKTSDLSYRWTGSAWQQVGGSGGGPLEQVQADWNEDDTTDPAYIKNKPTIPEVPTNVSSFTNDAGYLTQHQDISGKVDKETGKGLSTNDYTTAEKNKLAGIAAGAEVNVQSDWNQSNSSADDYIKNKPTIPAAQVNADWNAASGVAQVLNKPTIPTKVSDLTNDEAFITAEEVAGIVTAGDMAIVETSDYIDIFIYVPEVSITPATLSLYASQKSATITVSGSHLKGDIAISVPSGFTASPATIAHVGGVVEETDVTITYTGADASTASGSITATSVDTTATIPVAYTQYSGPTILADDSAITFKAGGGATNQQTLTVQGVNLEAGITAAISGTDAAKFSVSPASISQSGGTASETLTITYSPAAADSGTHTATLTLSSSGATSKVITLNGAVSSLTVSEQSMSFSTDQGVAVTDTFTVEGANLNSDITIAASGTGFSVSPQTIAQSGGTVASTTVTVTYSPSAAGTNTGSITIQSSGVTKTISLSGTATALPQATEENQYKFTKDGIYYKVRTVDGVLTDTVGVYNSTYNTSSAPSTNTYSGNVVIPSTVRASVDGVAKTLTVVSVTTYAFAECTNLKSLTIPDSVTSLGVAFVQSQSSNLKSIVIGNGATTIPNYTTLLGGGVTYLELGENVASVGTKGINFYLGSSCTVVIKHNSIISLNMNCFKNTSGSNPSPATLKVPSSLVDSYKAAAGWGVNNTYGWRSFNPENITAIDD